MGPLLTAATATTRAVGLAVHVSAAAARDNGVSRTDGCPGVMPCNVSAGTEGGVGPGTRCAAAPD